MKVISKVLLTVFVVVTAGSNINGMNALRSMAQRMKNTVTSPIFKDRAKAAAIVSAGAGAACGGIGYTYGLASKAYDQAKEKAKVVAQKAQVARQNAAEKARTCISKLGDAWYAKKQEAVVYLAEHPKQNKVTDFMLRNLLVYQQDPSTKSSMLARLVPFKSVLTADLLTKNPKTMQTFTRLATHDQETFNRVPYYMHDALAHAGSLTAYPENRKIGEFAAGRFMQPVAQHEQAAFESFFNRVAKNRHSDGQPSNYTDHRPGYAVSDFLYYVGRNEDFKLKMRTLDKTLTAHPLSGWNTQLAVSCDKDGRRTESAGNGLRSAMNIRR